MALPVTKQLVDPRSFQSRHWVKFHQLLTPPYPQPLILKWVSPKRVNHDRLKRFEILGYLSNVGQLGSVDMRHGIVGPQKKTRSSASM